MPIPKQSANGNALKITPALRARMNKILGGNMVNISPSLPGNDIDGATMSDAADLVQKITYLVPGWIAAGMVTGLVAEPGVGKSAFALWLARTVATGGEWFTGALGLKPANVLWCDTECTMSLTLDRMNKWKIPLDKLILPFGDDPLRAVDLTQADHIERLEKLIHKYQTPLVVIDSLRGSHDGDENSSRVGRILQALAGIAERTGAAIVVVHHTRKLTIDEEITANSSRGSNAIIAMFRSLIGFDKPDRNSPWVRFRVLKENLGIAPTPLGMRITSTGPEFSGDAPHRPKRDTAKDEAAKWLRNKMTPGNKYVASDIYQEAEQYGHALKTIQRAATESLGIKPEPVRNDEGRIVGWNWVLPKLPGR